LQAFDHRLLAFGRRVDRRQRVHRELARDGEHVVEARLVEGVARRPPTAPSRSAGSPRW
jgi:hypothetical protein